MTDPKPKPLFSSPADGWVPPTLHIDPEWEEERNVEESLPSSPVDARAGKAASVTPDPAFEAIEGSAMDTKEEGIFDTCRDENTNEVKRRRDLTSEEEDDPLLKFEPELEPEHEHEHTTEQQYHSHAAKEQDEDEEEGDRTCRICFSGPEEEESMGRLISPCLCTGSMRYVHVACLNAWRGTGTNAKAHMECPQCHYRYQLRRTLVSGLATSRPILLLSTFLTFTFLTLILGQSLHLILDYSPSISRSILSPSGSGYGYRSRTSIFDLLDDDPFNGGGGMVIIGGGGTLIYDIFVAAIQTFVDISQTFSDSRDRLKLSSALPGPLASMIFELGIRFLLGLAVLGSMSFLSLLISLSLFGPLQLMNGLRGAGFLGNWGRRRVRANGGGGGGRGSSIGTIMIVLLVGVGAINTLIKVYHTVQSLIGRMLKFVETQILEVNADEIKRLRKERERQRRMRKWWVVWLKDGRWKRSQGWKELAVRLRMRVQSWYERATLAATGNEHEE